MFIVHIHRDAGVTADGGHYDVGDVSDVNDDVGDGGGDISDVDDVGDCHDIDDDVGDCDDEGGSPALEAAKAGSLGWPVTAPSSQDLRMHCITPKLLSLPFHPIFFHSIIYFISLQNFFFHSIIYFCQITSKYYKTQDALYQLIQNFFFFPFSIPSSVTEYSISLPFIYSFVLKDSTLVYMGPEYWGRISHFGGAGNNTSGARIKNSRK